jgi:mannose-1-phosphate guanylyltransferase/mannose-6-phosphate isomerase
MPKQFAKLLDESLFAKTAKRISAIGTPWVITVKEMRALTENSLRELNLPDSQVIYEPSGKNTAPAIALLCKKFESMGLTNEIVGIFPADQLIEDDVMFSDVVRSAEQFAERGEIVTLGIEPTYPATGYGYIETSGPVSSGSTALIATGFREKPNEETARDFLNVGGFYWNAGMFIFRVSEMILAFQKYSPELWRAFSKLENDFSNLESVYANVRSISIDYAIMERLPSHICIPCATGWSDLGSWDSLATILGVSSQAKITEVEATGNFVQGVSNKIYALVGVSDLVVVDTQDALLISKKGRTEAVKQVVESLARS